MAKTKKKVAIGIDLGTSKCCVGVVRDGRVEILENERAKKTTPSYVAFNSTDRHVGEDAKDQACMNPGNTLFAVKRIIGRDFQQAEKFCRENRLSFDLVEEEGSPRFSVGYKNEVLRLSPEQITSMLLSKMKTIAESYLGFAVTDAVISVPAYFNDSQRRATKVAAKIAGLNVLKLIKEPTAAAITFSSNRRNKEKETIVMLDIGGGMFDTAVLVVDKGSVEVKTVKGDCHFGGQHFDTLLLNHFADQFQAKYGFDLREKKKSTERLRAACVKVKHTLSLLPTTKHMVECIADDIDFTLDITRKTFDELFQQSILDTMKPVLDLLLTNHKSVDHVVVVGGSIRVPKLQSFLKEYFQKDLMKTVNADEAVAYGAAYHAAKLCGDNSLPDIRVLDLIAPHSIDAVSTHNPAVVLVPKLSKAFGNANKRGVPLDACITFNETVHYWDPSKTEYNNLGVTYPDLPPASADAKESSKQPKNFEIDFGVDGDGMFFGPASKKRIEADSKSFFKPLYVKNMRSSEIQRMVVHRDKFEEDFMERQRQIQAYADLEALCFKLKQKLSVERELEDEQRQQAVDKCEEVLEWLEDDSDPPLDALQRKQEELVQFVSALVQREQLP